MMKTRMKKIACGDVCGSHTSHRFRANCSCRRAGTKLPDIRRKAVNQTLKLWYGSPAKINILPNPAAANGCSNLCLSETGIWEI